MTTLCGFCTNEEEPEFQRCYCTVVESPTTTNLSIIIPSAPRFPYHQRIQTRRSGGFRPFNIINGQQRRGRVRLLNMEEQPRSKDEIQTHKPINKTMEKFNHSITECPICYDEKNSTINHMIKTNCNHLFCKDCFDKVVETCFSYIISCPMCRTVIDNVIENILE
jgi:hypothetical protein